MLMLSLAASLEEEETIYLQIQHCYYFITHPSSLERSGKLHNISGKDNKLYKFFIESQITINNQMKTISGK